MKKNKAITVTTALVCLWLLFGLNTFFVNAENVPISKNGIEKIGHDKIRLESGIGAIVFDLSEGTGTLTSNGYLTMSNTYNSSVLMICNIKTQMSPVDLDENGKPRIHKKISDNIKFRSIPNPSWITLENERATIKPYHIYNYRYTVTIPYEETPSNNSVGFLVRINIKKQLLNATGANIGIDYDYKLFIIFTGEKPSNINLLQLMFVFIPVGIGGVVFVVYKKRNNKDKNKKTKTKKKKPEPIPRDNKSDLELEIKETLDTKTENVDVHKNIDDILKKNTKTNVWREDG